MHYEVHVTVDTANIRQFEIDCNSLKVKPIIIQTERNDEFLCQVMTSSKYYNRIPLAIANDLAGMLNNYGYEIKRIKIEKQPDNNTKDHIYYETHFRLVLPKDFNKDKVKYICNIHNFHMSKNLFKVSKDKDYQMITYRSYTDTLDQFHSVVSNMQTALSRRDIAYDKVEVEDCIYDSNISVDNQWLNKEL